VNLAVDALWDLGTQEVGHIFMAMNGAWCAESDMILDSVATSHMFHDTCHFMQYASVIDESIEIGDGHSLPIAGEGSITFKSQLPDGIWTVILHRVHHVSQLQMNVVSLSKSEKEGVSESFGGGGMKILASRDELFHATLSNSFYWINCTVPGSGVAYVTSSSVSLCLWHQHIGHWHLHEIQQLAQKDMVDGLAISSLQSFNHVCEDCVLGKLVTVS
jgi:hypothetical protein